MTLQNRVLPDGTIVADDWRGLFMGNRGGRIHDPRSRTLTRRRWASRRWIICLLCFRKRRRTVMGHGYTELFFHDEVSALSAGHRPCYECRREKAERFMDLLNRQDGHPVWTSVNQLDAQLHSERTSNRKMITRENIQNYPDATMFRAGNAYLALFQRKLFFWKPTGYVPCHNAQATVELLTPPTTLRALEAGYEPQWHVSIPAQGKA